jgi:hypothetical protein
MFHLGGGFEDQELSLSLFFKTPGKVSLLLRQRRIFQDTQQAARGSPWEEEHSTFMPNDLPIQFEPTRMLACRVIGESSYTFLRYLVSEHEGRLSVTSQSFEIYPIESYIFQFLRLLK